MTVISDKKHNNLPQKQPRNLFSDKNKRLSFFLTALIAIFVTETILMLIFSLLPPIPVIINAFIDSFLLVVIIYLIFWPQLKKEMAFQNSRFSETQETLHKSDERYRALVESTEDSIYLVDRQYRYVFINKNHLARLGHSARKLFKRQYGEFHSDEETQRFEAVVEKVFAMGKSIQQEHLSDRDKCYFLRTFSPVREKDGTVSAVMIISKQINEHKKIEEELRKLSLTDELTGLYNRRGFITLAEQQIKIANRQNKELLLISIDLDDLKIINDTMGHKEGDKALIDTASILQETFRYSDIIARIGGDEFAILQIRIPEDPLSVSTERLQKNLAKHNLQSGENYKLSLSFGSVVYNPEDAKTLDQLLAEADTKMYEQKKQK